jgi:hypothetical protein
MDNFVTSLPRPILLTPRLNASASSTIHPRPRAIFRVTITLGIYTSNKTHHALLVLAEAKRMGIGGSFANKKLVKMERLVIDVTCLILGIIMHALTLASLESNLEACDITFPVLVSNSPPATFRAIVSSLSGLQSSEEKARVGRLAVMNGGEHIAVILLLDGYKPMELFSRLQVEYAFTSLACLLPLTSSTGCFIRIVPFL